MFTESVILAWPEIYKDANWFLILELYQFYVDECDDIWITKFIFCLKICKRKLVQTWAQKCQISLCVSIAYKKIGV